MPIVAKKGMQHPAIIIVTVHGTTVLRNAIITPYHDKNDPLTLFCASFFCCTIKPV